MVEQRCSFIATDYNAININKSYERARARKGNSKFSFYYDWRNKDLDLLRWGQSTGSLKALRTTYATSNLLFHVRCMLATYRVVY